MRRVFEVRKMKYKNVKISLNINGKPVKFDSTAESERYLQLALLEKAGKISGLTLQPAFILHEKFKRNGKAYRPDIYIADFQYQQNGKTIVEDVKGVKTPVYKLKMKRFLFLHPDLVFIEMTKKNNKWIEKVY